MADLFDVTNARVSRGVSTFGEESQTETPPQSDDDSSLRLAEDDDSELVWGDEAETEREDEADVSGSDDGVDELTKLLFPDEPASQAQPPAQPQQTPAQPTQMPEWYDESLLAPGRVGVLEGQLRNHFEQKIHQTQDAAAQAAWNEAYILSVGALRQKAQLAQMTKLAHDLWQKNNEIHNQLEPYKRVQSARMLAEKFGIKDANGKTNYRALLTHPRLKTAINNPEVMVALAAMMGEESRQSAAKSRKGVDRPVTVTNGRSSKSIRDLDPFGKEFDAIEKAVESGRSVRLLG